MKITDCFEFEGKDITRSIGFENGIQVIEYRLGFSGLKLEIHPTMKEATKGVCGVEEYIIEYPSINKEGNKTAVTKILHKAQMKTLLKFSIQDIKGTPRSRRRQGPIENALEEMGNFGDIERILLINFMCPRKERTDYFDNYFQEPSHIMHMDVGFRHIGYYRHNFGEYPLYVFEFE